MTQTKSNYKVGRLIIVDDETELMTALCEILTRHGYETVGYTSGAEALAKLKEQDFDLLLTDLMMPEMDGIELLQAALKIDPDIVGIVMTGQGTVQTAVEAMKTGALDYIMKPFKLNGLLPVLSRAMEVHHLRAENMQLRETVAMHELGQALAFSSDLNQILNKVTDAVMQQCDADEASIMLPTSDGKELVIAVARGGHAEHIGKRIPMGQGIAGWVAQNREPVTLNGEVHDERFTSIKPRADISAAVSMPLIVGGSLIGVLNVNITRPHRPFTLGQVKTLIMLATIVSPILENARLYAEKRRAEDLYRTLAEGSLTVVFIVQDGKFRFINAAVASVGYSAEDLIGRHSDAIIYPEDREMVKKRGREVLRGEHTTPYEFRMVTKQGQIRWLMQIVSPILYEGRPAIMGNATDVTELKQAAETLRESEKQYRELTDFLPISIFEIDAAGSIISFNRTALEVFRYNEEDYKNGMNTLQFFAPEEWQRLGENIGNVIQGTSIPGQEFIFLRKDGSTFIGLIYASPKIHENKTVGIRGAIIDITERKLAEESLRHAEERYRSIFENAQEGIFQTTYEGQYLAANRALATILGYDSPEDLMTTVIDIPTQLYVNPQVRKVLLKMIEEQGPVMGFETQFYRKDDSIIWVSVNQQAVRDAEGRVLYYEGFNEDITTKKDSIERIKKALGATVQAIAVTVETRDPYTAGHQRRVADLARAIATEMNLPTDQIDAIRMAAGIHDLGKISVPAEILSKPSKLTDLEFGIIKTHAQSGYDILKDIEFPWPIARMVLEHHERMNGSGYPKGMVAEETLLESRILSVADVVESMASHRPYRPALGIDAALEEIENNRGTHYDISTVDACLRLFRENGYQLIKGT
jgi:PAS domain S-box-containing protein